MHAAQYLGPGNIQAVQLPVPVPGDGEALIQVEACGFCGSDLGIISGLHPRAKAPLTIGHELCGRVIETRGGASHIAVGDRVTLFPLISCGSCYVCRDGQPHVCRTLRVYGFDANGGMADFVKVPVKNLLKLPQSVSAEEGALIEPLAVAIHAVSRVLIRPEDSALIVGAGPIGLLTALALRHRGIQRVYVADVVGFRLELARRLGLDALDAQGNAALEFVKHATKGEGVDVLFECAGSPAAAAEMTNLVRCRGTIVNVSVFKSPVPINMQAVNFKELTIVGSRVYTLKDFQSAIEISSSLPLPELITHRLPLGRVGEGFQLFKKGERVCKVLIEPFGAAV